MSPAGRRPGRSRSTTSARPTVCPNRLRTLCAVFIIVIGGFGYRLADLQLTPDQALAEPISRTLRTEDLPAQRGSIVDRLGRPLAYSRPAPTIVADPRLISTEQVPYVVGQLAPSSTPIPRSWRVGSQATAASCTSSVRSIRRSAMQ